MHWLVKIREKDRDVRCEMMMMRRRMTMMIMMWENKRGNELVSEEDIIMSLVKPFFLTTALTAFFSFPLSASVIIVSTIIKIS